MEKQQKSVRSNANIGLWGSVAAVIVTAVLHYLLPVAASASTRWMLIAGSVLAVLAVSMSLLTIRKRIPALRQSDLDTEARLQAYSDHIRSLYMTMLAVVVIICLMTVLSGQNVLLMLAMVSTLMLFLAYPNIYRIKSDLGLTDEEAAALFGDRFISDRNEKQ